MVDEKVPNEWVSYWKVIRTKNGCPCGLLTITESWKEACKVAMATPEKRANGFIDVVIGDDGTKAYVFKYKQGEQEDKYEDDRMRECTIALMCMWP